MICLSHNYNVLPHRNILLKITITQSELIYFFWVLLIEIGKRTGKYLKVGANVDCRGINEN